MPSVRHFLCDCCIKTAFSWLYRPLYLDVLQPGADEAYVLLIPIFIACVDFKKFLKFYRRPEKILFFILASDCAYCNVLL